MDIPILITLVDNPSFAIVAVSAAMPALVFMLIVLRSLTWLALAVGGLSATALAILGWFFGLTSLYFVMIWAVVALGSLAGHIVFEKGEDGDSNDG